MPEIVTRSVGREVQPQTTQDIAFEATTKKLGEQMRAMYNITAKNAVAGATPSTTSTPVLQHISPYEDLGGNYADAGKKLRGEDAASIFTAEMRRSREWWKRK
jgi:hypothetical protein